MNAVNERDAILTKATEMCSDSSLLLTTADSNGADEPGFLETFTKVQLGELKGIVGKATKPKFGKALQNVINARANIVALSDNLALRNNVPVHIAHLDYNFRLKEQHFNPGDPADKSFIDLVNKFVEELDSLRYEAHRISTYVRSPKTAIGTQLLHAHQKVKQAAWGIVEEMRRTYKQCFFQLKESVMLGLDRSGGDDYWSDKFGLYPP